MLRLVVEYELHLQLSQFFTRIVPQEALDAYLAQCVSDTLLLVDVLVLFFINSICIQGNVVLKNIFIVN